MKRFVTILAFFMVIASFAQAVELGGGLSFGAWNDAGRKSFAVSPQATAVIGTLSDGRTRVITSTLLFYSNPDQGEVEALAPMFGVQQYVYRKSLNIWWSAQIGAFYEVQKKGDSIITVGGLTYEIKTSGENKTNFIFTAEAGTTIFKFINIAIQAGYVPYNKAHDALLYGGKVTFLAPLLPTLSP